MRRYDVQRCVIQRAEKLTADIFDFTVCCPAQAKKARPGQFAQLRVPGHTLRRPISICEIDRNAGTLRFVFQVRGEGTAALAGLREGDELDVLAPLGVGFPVSLERKTLLIGGGIGVPPLLGAADALGENAVAVLGFRNREAVILEEDFQKTGARTVVATDDGSYGVHGVAVEAAKDLAFETVFACGPLPMLRAVKAFAEERGADCFLSLEERMACGLGACLGCAVPLSDAEGRQYYGHVCSDGPVFDSRFLIL